MVNASELSIETVRAGTTANDMAEAIFGSGVDVRGATYTGDIDSAGIFEGGDAAAPGGTPSDSGVVLSTGEARAYTNNSGQANQSGSTTTGSRGPNNNAEFNAAAGARTYDVSFLDVDFIPDHAVLTMQFVFASEEYPEFQNSVYQDFVGVWINGTQVEMEVGNGDTDPGNVNSTNNENLFLDNTDDAYNTEMDGLTVTMTLTMNVVPGALNSIRIGIADVSDSNYDSNLLIAGNSLQTDLIATADNTHLDPNSTKTLDVLANDVNNGPGKLTITHVNGVPVVVGTTVTLKTGQTVALNSDGTLQLTGDGNAEDFNFTYTLDNGVDNDIGFVNVSSIPCFVQGTLIATPEGERPVEEILPDDLVLTRDDGPQPVRWAGSREVVAEGAFAPIYIDAGSFGAHRQLIVSPEHRVLIRDSHTELFFGETEVLVAAKDLVDGRNVRRVSGGIVTYVHLMFDRHQVVTSQGLETESFLFGPQTRHSFELGVVQEICALFPELDPSTGKGYSATARPTLKGYEATLWQRVRFAT